MATVIDIDNFILVRDFEDFISVFAFMPEGIIRRRLMQIKKNPGKIYFQCENEQTFVANNHRQFYNIPNDVIEDFKEILIHGNYQTIPWEAV